MRVVDYIINEVYKVGVKHVFTITGGGAMFLNDAVAAHPSMTPVCNHHEQASAMAAVAYSKYTGKTIFSFSNYRMWRYKYNYWCFRCLAR